MPNDNNRVLTRRGARQLSQDEIEQTSGAGAHAPQRHCDQYGRQSRPEAGFIAGARNLKGETDVER